MARFATLTALTVTILCAGGSPALAAPPCCDGAFSNPDQDAAPIEAAIDDALSELNIVARAVARSQIKGSNPPLKDVEIETEGAEVMVRYDGGKPVPMHTDGRPIEWTGDDGEVFQVNGGRRGGRLLQAFDGEPGRRVNTFSLAPDGNTLYMDVEVSSERLPEPIRYRLEFQRSGSAQR